MDEGEIRILIVGDLVGEPGRLIFARTATRMKAVNEVDMVVANAENAAAGRGITGAIARELFDAGADVLTLGDHTWNQKELASDIACEPRLLRPANFAPGCPGTGMVTVETPRGPVTVINLIGRAFMAPHDCPFRCADALLRNQGRPGRVVLVDLHAEATSEKIVMGRYLDGRVTAVVGTHTHVQTSDEAILPKGTAYITDLGMTGAKDSALGRDVEPVLHALLTGMPAKFTVATGDVRLEGVIVQADVRTGRALRIERVRLE